MNKISVRRAEAADIGILFSIESEASGGWPITLFESEFKNGSSKTVIAEIDGESAGYAIVWIIGHEIQLNKISVRPSFRRMGIASGLIACLKKEFKPAKIILEVAEKNISAIGLYESAGFIKTGFRKNYYPEDNAILMDCIENEN